MVNKLPFYSRSLHTQDKYGKIGEVVLLLPAATAQEIS
jgi:hypothetical protein